MDIGGIGRFTEASLHVHPDELRRAGRKLLPFVTISRQVGARGRELAALIVKMLDEEADEAFRGWRVFDRALCERIAQAPNVHVSIRGLLCEHYRSEFEDYLTGLIAGVTPQAEVVRRVFAAVQAVASEGKAVIVGRAGACLTRTFPCGVHLRLVASVEERMRIIMKLQEIDEREARTFLRDRDAERARFVRDRFDRDIDDPLLYDAVWNVEKVPLEAIADATIGLVRSRYAESRPKVHPAAVG